MRIERRMVDWIDAVVLLRPAAVTHHFDNDQRYIELAFSTENPMDDLSGPIPRTEEDLRITAPDDTLGPAGYYMLFVIETDGLTQYEGHRVPSLAEFIKIQ